MIMALEGLKMGIRKLRPNLGSQLSQQINQVLLNSGQCLKLFTAVIYEFS
jgi:hypothetical protein